MKAPARFFKKRPPVLVMASTLCLLSLTASCPFSGKAHIFRASWPEGVVRAWVGPEFWANRLQDWRVAQGRLECLESSSEKPMRTVHLLTRSLGEEKGDFRLKVLTGLLEAEPEVIPEDAASGFLVGTGPDWWRPWTGGAGPCSATCRWRECRFSPREAFRSMCRFQLKSCWKPPPGAVITS